MYREILELLKCPQCSCELSLEVEREESSEIVEGRLICNSGHNYIINEGVINFNSLEQTLANNWTESYEQYDYDELDKEILEKVPKNQIQLGNKVKEYIIDSIKNEENEFILDIATGRGELFREMLKILKNNSQIICTDLSFEVLKYDRLKAKKINASAKVNYIACDATNLPFKDNTIDANVSFYGIQNMLNLASDGMRESRRVLKLGKIALDSYIIIDEYCKGFKTLTGFCEDNTIIGAENVAIKSGIEKAYTEANFTRTDIITIGESIGEKNELDLLPFEDEWFAIVVSESIK